MKERYCPPFRPLWRHKPAEGLNVPFPRVIEEPAHAGNVPNIARAEGTRRRSHCVASEHSKGRILDSHFVQHVSMPGMECAPHGKAPFGHRRGIGNGARPRRLAEEKKLRPSSVPYERPRDEARIWTNPEAKTAFSAESADAREGGSRRRVVPRVTAAADEHRRAVKARLLEVFELRIQQQRILDDGVVDRPEHHRHRQ